ncbi:MAG: DUF2723 domain-containing protein [bacterium]
MGANISGGSIADPQTSTRACAGSDTAALRRRYLWAAAVFIGALAFYIKSAAPDFLFDDNPEFIATSYYLGIAHSPGYPLVSLLGKLFTYAAPGSAGFAVNLISVFAGAAAIALGFLLLMRATGWVAPSLLGAAMMAVSRLFWEQAGQADVYAINGFFLFLTFHILWSLDKGRRDAMRLAALSGVFILALFNHYTMVLVFPVYAGYIFWLYRGSFPAFSRIIPLVVFMAAVGFSVMMYLPLRSASNPALNWDDQSFVAGFVKHVRGVDLRKETPRVSLSVKWRFVEDYAGRLWKERTPFLLPLLPLGFWALAAGGRRFGRGRGWLLIGAWFFLFAGYIMLPNYLYGPRASYVVKSFHCTSLLMLAFFMGFGADSLLRVLKKARLPWGAVFGIAAALAVYSGLSGRTSADHANDTLAPVYGRNMLRTMARDGILFSTLETETFPVMNLRAIHGLRRDITLHGRHGDTMASALTIGKPGQDSIEIAEVRDIEKFAIKHTVFQRKLFFTKRLDVPGRPDLAVITNGLLYQLSPEGKWLSRPDPWNQIDMTGINYRFKEYDTIQRGVLSRYLVLRGEHYLELGQLDRAVGYLKRAEKFNPGSRFLRANLGAIYMRVGDFKEARNQFEAGLAGDPENVETSIDTVAMYSNLSFIYGAFGEDAKALKAIETAVDLDKKNELLRVNLGKTYWHNDNCFDAVRQLEISIRLGINDAGVYNVLGICNERLGHYRTADKYYEKALATNPALPEVYRDFGIFNAYVMDRPARAVELLNTYLEIAQNVPDEAEIRANIGFLNQGIEKYEAAIASFRMALLLGADTTPRKAAVINGALAVCLEKAGRADEAAAEFEKGLAGANEYPQIYVDYADFLDRQKKTPGRALRLLDKYLAAVPNPKDRIRVDLIRTRLKTKIK